jgi:precorrin-3B C17-methyltransferase
MNRLLVVGLGPGSRATLTPQALEAVRQADVVIGYSGYFAWVADLVAGKECIALPLTKERERACLAVQHAAQGHSVCVISSGDAGVYGMASLVLEVLERTPPERRPDVQVIPGLSAVIACAALLGAPLAHDFAAISLSDLLTPWAIIERRLLAAAEADFVVALFNPRSERRSWQLARAQELLLRARSPETPVGIVRNAYRPDQSVELASLGRMAECRVDMLTTIIVGNSQTRRFDSMLITPRGYLPAPDDPTGVESGPDSGRPST